MTTYYVKGGKVFSNSQETISIPHSFSSFTSTPLTEDNCISSLQEYIKSGYKTYTIYGVISNYSQIQDELSKKKKQKPKDDDYTFIEITSQPEIVKQLRDLVEELKSEFPPKTLLKHLDDKAKNDSKRKLVLEEELEKINLTISSKQKEKDKLKEDEVNKQEQRNKTLQEDLDSLEQKKHKYEELLNNQDSKHSRNKRLISLQQHIESLNHNIQQLEYDIELLKAKQKTLQNEKKLGKKKKLSAIQGILSLGLLYWTSYADISYQIKTCSVSILKKEELKISYKKKLFLTEHKKDELEKQEQFDSKQRVKQQESIMKSIEELDEEIKNHKETLTKSEKELEKAKQKLEPVENKLVELNQKKESIQNELYNLVSKEKGQELIKQINDNYDKTIEELNSILSKYSKQTTSHKGEGIIEL